MSPSETRRDRSRGGRLIFTDTESIKRSLTAFSSHGHSRNQTFSNIMPLSNTIKETICVCVRSVISLCHTQFQKSLMRRVRRGGGCMLGKGEWAVRRGGPKILSPKIFSPNTFSPKYIGGGEADLLPAGPQGLG